jgi:hypothetical protein
MTLSTPPSSYVPSSSGDASSQYNFPTPLSPQWTGVTSAPSTHLGPPTSHHPSMYYTTSPGPQPAPPLAAPPWAVPVDPNAHPQPHTYMHPPNVAPGPSPSPGAEKAQFSGFAGSGHQDALPAWAVDHKRPPSRPPNSAGPSGSGSGTALSNVLEQPGEALPPPAYSEAPSSL